MVNVGVGVTLCADTSLIIKTRREVFLFLEQKLETETMRCDSARRDPCQPNHLLVMVSADKFHNFISIYQILMSA